MFIKGIVVGWLIVIMVWLLLVVECGKIVVIVIIMYVIVLGDFIYIIVGLVEVFYLVFDGVVSWIDYVMCFVLLMFVGNIVGGSLIFVLISYV